MLASWSKRNPYYAIVTDGNVISIHNCVKNEFLRKITLSFHISTTYSTLKYVLSRSTKIQSSTRKRRRVQAKKDVLTSHVIGGSGQGNIFVFQEDGTLLKEIDVGVSSEIQCIEFVEPHEILLVVGSRSVMLISQIFNSTVTSEIKNIREFEQPSESTSLEDEDSLSSSNQNRNISILKLSNEGKHIAVSFEGELCIYEYFSRKMIRSFPAFPTGSSFLHWLGEAHVLIGCREDRYFYIHNILETDDNDEDEGKDTLFSVPSNPVSVDSLVITNKRRTKLFAISIVTEEGYVYVYFIEITKIRRRVSVKCELATKVRCIIENINHSRQKQKKNRVQKFISGRFVDYDDDENYEKTFSLDLVTGTIYNPQFHQLSIKTRNRKEMYTIKVEADNIEGDADEEEEEEGDFVGEESKGKGKGIEETTTEGLPTVMGQVNMNSNLSRFQSSIMSTGPPSHQEKRREKMIDEDDSEEEGKKDDDDEAEKEEEEEEEEDVEIVEESLLTLPDAPEGGEDEESLLEDARGGVLGGDVSIIHTASSSSLDLAQSLCTALKFHDYPQIRRLIDTIGEKNDGVISSVIKSCPSSPYSVQLLEFFITSIKQRQSDEESLSDLTTSSRIRKRRRIADIKWMKYLLLHHSRYLLEREDLSDFLSPLYHHLSAQLSIFSLLTDVSGRLDLLLSLGGYSQISTTTTQSSSLEQEKIGIRNEDIRSLMFGDDDDEEEDDDEDDEDGNNGMVNTQVDERKVVDEDEEEEDDEDDERRLGFLMGLNEGEIEVLKNAKIPGSSVDDNDDDEEDSGGEESSGDDPEHFEMEDEDMNNLKLLVGGSDEEDEDDDEAERDENKMDLGDE